LSRLGTVRVLSLVDISYILFIRSKVLHLQLLLTFYLFKSLYFLFIMFLLKCYYLVVCLIL